MPLVGFSVLPERVARQIRVAFTTEPAGIVDQHDDRPHAAGARLLGESVGDLELRGGLGQLREVEPSASAVKTSCARNVTV